MLVSFAKSNQYLINRLSRRISTKNCLSTQVRQKLEQDKIQTYNLQNIGIDSVQRQEDISSPINKLKTGVNTSINYLLPKGYPHSVRSGYGSFVTGQIVSNTLSTAAGVLSMQSLLYAMGIGMGMGLGTAPLAATLNWVIKDGLGQLGGVLFASFVNNRFDSDPKRWRLTATIAMDTASFMEMLTPLAPKYFLFIASIANVSKNISFLAASASRAAIHRSFTLQENLADVTAKTGSQSIISSLIGTSLGVSISSLISWSIGDATLQYHSTIALYCILSTTSIAITYWSLRYVTITSLSIQRLEYLLHDYFTPLMHNNSNIDDNFFGTNDQNSTNWKERKLISPEELRQVEHWLGVPMLRLNKDAVVSSLIHTHSPSDSRGGSNSSFSTSRNSVTSVSNSSIASNNTDSIELPLLQVGCDLHEVVESKEEYEELCTLFHNEAFLLHAVTTCEETNNTIVYILFKEYATDNDILRAHMLAFLVRTYLWKSGDRGNNNIINNNIKKFIRSDKMKNTDKNRILRLDILRKVMEFDHELNEKNGNENLLNHFITKIMSDDDWKISSTMLETRYARLCS